MKKTFKKNERLCSLKIIGSLFDRNNSANEGVFAYPVRVVCKSSEETHTQVLFSVPKRQFKHAADRNLIRRRMKEAYRLNKELLKNSYYISFIYVGKVIENYVVIEKGIKNCLKKL
ncbi:ribonuclease P protein component [Emticicia sp. BO119]|uniref:ribonuclease P protein component n=1 Tax=Emticicia sp. BO119 TaxID=2757768 RepID=UPI0015F05F93|nr:ribonuclease P protein component [Emticicia sp. BO119]MBA4852585.1 ribonuclease P protein component [Emticicia sp. BO119]